MAESKECSRSLATSTLRSTTSSCTIPLKISQSALTKPYLNHVSDRHPKCVLESFNSLRINGELCDVCIKVGSRSIKAHKTLLSACSPYFRAMFTGEMAESRQHEVSIQDVDERAMELLIDFSYTSTIRIDESNVQTLLPAACLLQLTEIQDACCEFLKKQLDASNCLGIRSFADTHSCGELLRVADMFTHQNFQEVMDNEEFLLLPVDQLIEILSSDELNVTSEEQVYNAAMKWIRYNVTERKGTLAEILQHVRLPLVSARFLVGVVSTDLLVKNDESCRDLVDDAKNYLLLPEQRPLMQGPRTRPRQPTRRGEVLFAVGGWCSGDAINSVESLDRFKRTELFVQLLCSHATLDNTDHPLPGIPLKTTKILETCHITSAKVAAMVAWLDPGKATEPDGIPGIVLQDCSSELSSALSKLFQMFILRRQFGCNDGRLTPSLLQISQSSVYSVFVFDPQKNEWHMVASMNKRRCGVGVAVLEDLLYAVGGHDGSSYLNSVERYDPKTNQWSSEVAPTSTCRTSVGVAVLDSFMYAVGGQDGVSCLNIVEKYDAKLNQWTRVAPMSTRRLGVAVAVLDGFLYAIGGSDGTSPLNTVEKYDPESNRWSSVHSMSTRRKHLGAAVFQGYIYAVGGRDDATELSSAERYDPQTNQWSAIVALNSRRSGVGLSVVNGQLIAVGGFDGTTYLKTIEVYDPKRNQWKMQSGMNYRRLGGGVGVVTLPHCEGFGWQ